MRRLCIVLLLSLSAVLLIVAGCGQGVVSNGDADDDVPYIPEVKAPELQIKPDPEPETPGDEGPDKDEHNGNDGNDNGEVVEREVEITIPGLLRALSATRVGDARPHTREIPLEHENGESLLTFRLVNVPRLPFSTYIPGENSYSGFRLFTGGHLQGVYSFIEQDFSLHGGNSRLLRISDARPEDSHMGQYLDILFFEPSTGLAEARQYLKQSMEPAERTVHLEGQHPDWLVEAYTFEGGDTGESLGFGALGTYKGEFFLLYSVWDREGEAAWLSTVRVILEEWYWKARAWPRSPEEVFTIFIEGDEHQIVYRLINLPHVPFTAYFPADTRLIAESMQTGQLNGVRLGNMDIMFYPENMSKREAELEFELMLSYLGDMTAVSPEEVPSWALAKYTGWDRNSSKTGILGEYGGRFFYIREQYPPEYGDGWLPVRSVLFSTWHWKDSGTPLY